MARQARVRVGGRPQGRSGIDEFLVISALLAREDLRVGAAPEMHDALFRTNSAVILPEGEDPAKTQSGTRALTSVGLFSTLLRYNEEHPSHIDASGKEVRKKLLIAGHSDTKGSDQFNQPLSEERAKVTLALLTGGQKGRDDFAKLCLARHDGIDLTQIFHWVADSDDFNFQCKPTRWDQTPSPTTVSNFKKAYNAAFDEKFKDMEGAKRFPNENGTQDAALWGAIFDCYEYGLRCELGDMETSTEGTDELKRLRGMLTWVDANHQSMGFGERFPVDELTKKDVRSQSNRRVEIMMFDEGEEPDLAAAVADPEVMETYLPGAYGKVPVKPMETARRVSYRLYLAVARAPAENPTKFSYKVTESQTGWEQSRTTDERLTMSPSLDCVTFRIPPVGLFSLWLMHSGASPFCLMRDVPYERLAAAGPTSAFRESDVGTDDVPADVHTLDDEYLTMV